MKRRSESIRDKLLPAAAFLLILLIWWGLSVSGLIPGYMLPSPVDVVKAFAADFPNLMSHAWVSVEEALTGLLIGICGTKDPTPYEAVKEIIRMSKNQLNKKPAKPPNKQKNE